MTISPLPPRRRPPTRRRRYLRPYYSPRERLSHVIESFHGRVTCRLRGHAWRDKMYGRLCRRCGTYEHSTAQNYRWPTNLRVPQDNSDT